MYNSLNDEYEASKSAADDVSERIDKVQGVADALFAEWEDELEEYQSTSLKRESETKLRETRRRYDSMLRAMRKAESKMEPVLKTLHDNVLYLKHNLNANAIGALQGEFGQMKGDINSLIEDMNDAIAESDAFIKAMK